MTESEIQRAYFEWARLHHTARHAFAIPNGGSRRRVEAAIMKAEGVTAGVPDVMLPKVRGGCGALWLEFKSATGTLRPEQRARISALVDDGYCVAVVRTPEAAISITERYLRGELHPARYGG